MLGSEVSAQKEMTFKEAAEAWMKKSVTRSRKPAKETSMPTVEGAFRNYVFPEIGSLPLSQVHNGTCVAVVNRMKKAKLSSSSMNGYFNLVRSVMKAQVDPVTGELKYPRKWSMEILDLPEIEHLKQPCLTAAQIETMLQRTCKGSWEHRLFMLLAATGMRVGEALGLEWSHLVNNGRTIKVEQQENRWGEIVKGKKGLKTKAAWREVDVHPDIAKALLADRPGSGEGLMFPSANGTPMLPGNVEKRRLRDFVTGSFHQFRRFRITWLKSPKVNCNEMLRHFWTGHKPENPLDEAYIKLSRDLDVRLAEAERVGYGFTLHEGCAPHPRFRSYRVSDKVMKSAKLRPQQIRANRNRRIAIEIMKDRMRRELE